MKLQITCPECSRQSLIDSDKVPLGKIKTTCNTCRKQFLIDKGQNVNCCLVQPSTDAASEAEQGSWKIDRPEFEGIEYDLNGLGGLIRSGMVTGGTRILPPKGSQYREASKIKELRKFFEQKEKRDG